MHYTVKEDGQSLGINLWPKKSKRKRGDIGMKAKAGLRKIEEALAAKKTKAKKMKIKTYPLWGKQASGFAGHRGRQNFLWAAKTKTLLKRLGF